MNKHCHSTAYFLLTSLILVTRILLGDLPSDIKLYTLVSATHESFLQHHFLPSLQDSYQVIPRRIDFYCDSALEHRHADIVIAKCDLILDAIKDNWGSAFIYSDVESEFLGSTAPLIEQALNNYDITFLLNAPDGTSCAGFFVSKANEKTLHFWNLVKEIVHKEYPECSIQRALNTVLLQQPTAPEGLAWGYFPITHFMGGGTFNKTALGINQDLMIPSDLRFFHANFVKNFSDKAAVLKAVHDTLEKKTHNAHRENKPFIFDHKKVLCVSIPKTGTHLSTKLITMMVSGHMSFRYWTKGPYTVERCQAALHDLTHNQMLQTHAWYSVSLGDALQEQGVRCLLTYRDPRDQIVSHAFHILKRHTSWLSAYPNITLPQVITELINRGKKDFVSLLPPAKPSEFHAANWRFVTLAQEYKHFYLPWLHHDNAYGVQFEKLVGPHGGGSQAAQTREIVNIAHHIGLEMSEEEAARIGPKLWGASSTFREGRIGSWKKYFTKEHKEMLKKDEEFCQLLIELGYEKDTDW